MRYTSETNLVDNSRLEAADEALVSHIVKAGQDPEQITRAIAGRCAADVRLACERLLSDDPTRAEQVLVVGRVSGMRSVMMVAIQKLRIHPYYQDDMGRIQLRDAEKALERAREHVQHDRKSGLRHNGNGKH